MDFLQKERFLMLLESFGFMERLMWDFIAIHVFFIFYKVDGMILSQPLCEPTTVTKAVTFVWKRQKAECVPKCLTKLQWLVSALFLLGLSLPSKINFMESGGEIWTFMLGRRRRRNPSVHQQAGDGFLIFEPI